MLSHPNNASASLRHFTVEYPRPEPKPRLVQTVSPVVTEMRHPLTVKQTMVLRFIHSFRSEHNVGPTLQEIADAAHVAKSDASRYVHLLLRVGALQGQYAVFGERKRLREGSLHVAADVVAVLAKDEAHV